ncbi:hypothetical protein EV651_108270 [Kribbella sp. VKM Ac-2571]|uniref:hypothetical protein n=1 Tax=Kribbella sp. VKM Ac-2571 TaxID=2512222 RepID=UPI00106150A3|nr:hypothetical protein [Kribbella sp. VKM Ac-2571]TDO59922.1 hypothetical protein EV651_108270 [Kribbella sp. VKM Ac-2571]
MSRPRLQVLKYPASVVQAAEQPGPVDLDLELPTGLSGVPMAMPGVEAQVRFEPDHLVAEYRGIQRPVVGAATT